MSQSYLEKYKERLDAFTRMSMTSGSKSDYVQGGGGNTSCKLDDRLMAIKASGYRIDQIRPDKGYAVMDYSQLRAFYGNTDPSQLDDIEKQGSAVAKEATIQIPELDTLRPSVEAGFHSMLDTFVLHSHSVYANLITCSDQGREIAQKLMTSIGINYAYVPYINPGAQLTFAIASAREAARNSDGQLPQVIFMENHGLIVTMDDADECLRLHDKVNEAISHFFSLAENAWPEAEVTVAGENDLKSATNWLQEQLKNVCWTVEMFTSQALYPDQLVFLAGQLREVEEGSLDQWLASGATAEEKCIVFRQTGEVFYQCKEPEALTIEQTLIAILFIHKYIKAQGYTVKLMSEAGKSFISNWESEKYRKTIAEK
jgi:ribulose-5-phosphate 4-epimerase/fuculose-1-phosphate aldolase